MSDGLFTSNVGSFAISSMSVGDTIGSASTQQVEVLLTMTQP